MTKMTIRTIAKVTRLRKPLTLALGLTAAVVLTSCGQTNSPAAAPNTTAPATQGQPDAGPASTSPATSVPSASPSKAAGKRIDISVKGKQVTPEPSTINIAVGESLTIAVTSDKGNTLHAHGFEVEKDLKAGQPGEITIKGAQTGVFEFELHDPQLLLFKVAVS